MMVGDDYSGRGPVGLFLFWETLRGYFVEVKIRIDRENLRNSNLAARRGLRARAGVCRGTGGGEPASSGRCNLDLNLK